MYKPMPPVDCAPEVAYHAVKVTAQRSSRGKHRVDPITQHSHCVDPIAQSWALRGVARHMVPHGLHAGSQLPPQPLGLAELKTKGETVRQL